MSQEGVNPAVAGNTSNIAQALMEEDLQREIEKNEVATKMAMEREVQALEARKRAQESQIMMKAMLEKYEHMKDKLDSTKKHLDETTTKISEKEKITDKIVAMKARIEAYANKKEAVTYLTDHVQMKHDMHVTKLESVKEDIEGVNTEGISQNESSSFETKNEENMERLESIKAMMKEREDALKKRELIKVMLEKQLLLGEKKAAEQARITDAREKLLELKMKELELQKVKLERKKREQEQKEKATEDFFVQIDKQLEEMESKAAVAQATGAVPKQKAKKGKGKGRNRSKSNTPKVMSPEPFIQSKANTPKIMSPEPKAIHTNYSETKILTPKVTSPEPEQEKPTCTQAEDELESMTSDVKNTELIQENAEPEMEEQEQAKSTSKDAENEKECVLSQITEHKQENPEPELKANNAETLVISMMPQSIITEGETNKEVNTQEDTVKSEFEKCVEKPIKDVKEENNVLPDLKEEKSNEDDKKVDEYRELSVENLTETKESVSDINKETELEDKEPLGEKKMTEEEVKEMVAKVENKCKNIHGDIADMAMSEQYLRTKQALLVAKKKEQEMKIAEKMATIREQEVLKMKQKVQQMQELLASRKQKLKITEEIMEEKESEKKAIDKQIESTKRRENYVENQIVETVMFEKPPKKK